MADLPGGTVTFLFTDIQGSTQLLHHLGDSYGHVLEDHRRLLRAAFALHRGQEVDTQGDAFFVVFERAGDAIAAAAAAQRALHEYSWPQGGAVRVRMGLHTGEPQRTSSGYFGIDVHRGARIMAAGHGGQVLLSRTVRELVEESLPAGLKLNDLGQHRLKDLNRAEHLCQLIIDGLPDQFPPLKTLNNLPSNLPAQMSSFVGRETQLQEVEQLLSRTRLLTLTGAGGTGKTRLSLQVGVQVLEKYDDGVWLVELAPLSDPELVPKALATVLGVREVAGQCLIDTLHAHLAEKKLLIVLDNCEHVLVACAQLAHELLRSCPKVRILASSREALGVGGEQVYRVPSLSLPPAPSATSSPVPVSVHDLSQYEAVQLFIERALSVSPSFKVTNQNAPALSQICHRLDGIPLALELAAARVKAMSLEQINARLEDRFRLLTGGSRTALPRQQTLRALIDWGYDLLELNERALLQRMSVFAGGWTLEGAEAVGADSPTESVGREAGQVEAGPIIEDWEVMDLISHLVEKSLVVYDEREGESRYHLLETVRQYAHDRLRESGTVEATRRRHLNFFLQLAERATIEISGPGQILWLERLEQEHDNMRAALAGARQDTAQHLVESALLGLRMGTALQPFWRVRGYWSEGREQLRLLLSSVGAQQPTSERAGALMAAGVLATCQADTDAAGASYQESLTIRREIGDRHGVAGSLAGLGNVAYRRGDYISAHALYEESLSHFREFNDQRGIYSSLIALGNVTFRQGDVSATRAFYEESLALQREIGDRRGIALSLNNLGLLAYNQKDYKAAQDLDEESLALFRELGDKGGTTYALACLGRIACRQGYSDAAHQFLGESLALSREIGDKHGIIEILISYGILALHHSESSSQQMERAAQLWGAIHALSNSIGFVVPPDELHSIEPLMSTTRVLLGEQTFATAWDAGQSMTLEQATTFAMN